MGADVKFGTGTEYSSLIAGIMSDSIAIVELLLRSGAEMAPMADVNISPLLFTVAKRPAMAELLSKNGADPNDPLRWPRGSGPKVFVCDPQNIQDYRISNSVLEVAVQDHKESRVRLYWNTEPIPTSGDAKENVWER